MAGNGAQFYFAIRGREQQLIDKYGGIGHLMVANKRRGVGRYNRKARYLHRLSNDYFGELSAYTGI